MKLLGGGGGGGVQGRDKERGIRRKETESSFFNAYHRRLNYLAQSLETKTI